MSEFVAAAEALDAAGGGAVTKQTRGEGRTGGEDAKETQEEAGA